MYRWVYKGNLINSFYKISTLQGGTSDYMKVTEEVVEVAPVMRLL